MFKSKNNLLKYLKLSYRDYLSIIDNIANYYYTFEKPKLTKRKKYKISNGKIVTRTIRPCRYKLELLHIKLFNLLKNDIKFPKYYSGGIKGKSNIVNAKYHQGNHYFFSTDLTNFFPSISAKMIYQSLIKVGYSADVSNIITRLCTLNNELPQGIHPATFIANIVTMEMTSELKNFCEQYNITFSIYVDDLNFSSKTDFADKTNEIVRIIIKYGFKINRKKTFYKRGKALITGCIVRQNKVTPPSYVYYNFNRESISNKKEAIERYINRFNH